MLRKALTHIVIILSTLLVMFFFPGFNFEYLHSYVPSMLSGNLTGGHPINPWFFTFNYPLVDWVYLPLYRFFSSYVPVYEIFMYGFMLGSGAVIATALHEKLMPAHRIKYLIACIVCVIYFCLLLNLQHTVTAFFLLTAAGILMLQSAQKKIYFFISLLLFILGMFVRAQASVFFVFIYFPLIFFFSERKKVQIGLLILFTVISLTHYNIILKNRKASNDYAQKLDLIVGHQLMDRENIVPLSEMQNQVDSIKYVSVVNAISDPQYITIDFIKSLIGKSPFWGISQDLFHRAIGIYYQSIKEHSGIVLLYVLIALVSIYSLKRNKRKVFGSILFNLFFAGFIFLVIYFIKMESWLFRSAVFMMIVFNILIWDFSTKQNRSFIQIMNFLLIISLFIFIGQEKKKYSELKEKTEFRISVYNKIAKKHSGKIIVLGLNYNQILEKFFPFQKPDFSAFKYIFLFDSDTMFWQKDYNDWVKSICNCNTEDIVGFLEYLSKEGAIFFSNVERVKLIELYVRLVYQKEISFNIIDSISYNGETLYSYTIAI